MINRTKKVQNNTSEGPNYDQKGASEHLGDHIFYLIGASESKKVQQNFKNTFRRVKMMNQRVKKVGQSIKIIFSTIPNNLILLLN